jgi:hypothetical protein
VVYVSPKSDTVSFRRAFTEATQCLKPHEIIESLFASPQ